MSEVEPDSRVDRGQSPGRQSHANIQLLNFYKRSDFFSGSYPGVTSKILGSITASNNWCLSQATSGRHLVNAC